MSETLPHPFGPTMRLYFNELILNIKHKIPVTLPYLKESLESIQDSLFHRAPETLRHFWNDIHSFLINNIPIGENPPQWKLDIQKIWVQALEKYNQINRKTTSSSPVSTQSPTCPNHISTHSPVVSSTSSST